MFVNISSWLLNTTSTIGNKYEYCENKISNPLTSKLKGMISYTASFI